VRRWKHSPPTAGLGAGLPASGGVHSGDYFNSSPASCPAFGGTKAPPLAGLMASFAELRTSLDGVGDGTRMGAGQVISNRVRSIKPALVMILVIVLKFISN